MPPLQDENDYTTFVYASEGEDDREVTLGFDYERLRAKLRRRGLAAGRAYVLGEDGAYIADTTQFATRRGSLTGTDWQASFRFTAGTYMLYMSDTAAVCSAEPLCASET